MEKKEKGRERMNRISESWSMAGGLLFSKDRSRGRRYDGKRIKRSKRARKTDGEKRRRQVHKEG